eukprot:CAMPEP_0170485510 /NCGR_PEP_ID=MMETSP0208-20121228/4771_1 /TAXON_ID=197538 /ORGANISM="Strombidium inclinatum, Strain S3" /LENGTH=76 /DNA_ID=CAMNT_0010759197 /DNA_START=1192 /DNA_END=1422 /DNA_ORIENTATION=-
MKKNPDIQEAQFKDKLNIMPLTLVFKILSKWDEELDMGELECIIANLIAKGFIKGYIHHDSKKLILAKEGAFPALG